MSDTARDYKKTEPASTEGLEDLFGPLATPGQANTDQGLTTPDHPMTGLSIEEAAKALSVKPRTVLRRLQKGALTGFKIDGQFGPEWRVANFGPLATPGQANTDQGLTTPDQPNTHDSGVDGSELVAELRQQITELKTELDRKISEAQREIQAAAFRNGYLESQLEAEREQVKLLTDSQHKTGRWRRFYSWFIGH
jgi:hypothetical protein